MRSDKGVEWEPVKDRAKLVADVMELEKEGGSLHQLVSALASSRLTDADELLRLCGTTYQDFLAMGFEYDDLADVVRAIYEAVGFTERLKASPKPTGRRSSKA